LDALWLDINYSHESQYFSFDEENFKEEDILEMNYQIEDHRRHLVVIADPHIKDDDRYFVRYDGRRLQ
jgi:mannosyl-oligosaccharide alpha-1,3-glucosidase